MMTAVARSRGLGAVLDDFALFSQALYPDRALRPYQLAAARPILESIVARAGGRFVLLFSRQSGKDELLAQLQAFLLARYRRKGGGVVMAAPTFKPQCLVSRRRLIARTATPLHPGTHGADGYRLVCGGAGVSFLSAEPEANVRGETADGLLIANEAQDIRPDIWDARFAPMAASTNAPSRVQRDALGGRVAAVARDALGAGRHAIFRADWQVVAASVPAYGAHVRERMAQLGADHPFIRTEYGLEELDAAGGLFPPRRQAQMRGTHPRRTEAEPGHAYALLVDLAGEDEDAPADLAQLVARAAAG